MSFKNTNYSTIVNQWRHCHLLFLAMFIVVWACSVRVIPVLEDTRIGGSGLHPGDVFLLMSILKLAWLLPAGVAIIYVLSFALKQFNTAEAIAGIGLVSSAILALVVLAALIEIQLH
ncbi:MAG TPA: hypothetical protein VN048_17185 [Verrucomicrobiae bacterium]|jgi:hypothetical protein|nr:hypothetical protein [Verrucomicrobiae bacterium]